MLRVVIFAAALHAVVSANECIRRKSLAPGDDDGHYCVCNATYCDAAPKIVRPGVDSTYTVVTSSKCGLRFSVAEGSYRQEIPHNKSMAKIIINPSYVYQKIIGFGGAITDSAGLNIKSLSEQASDNLMRTYFSPHGIEYNLIRTPMGGSDFSERPYSYTMTKDDFTLQKFELQPEDLKYKIPLLKEAIKLSERKIKLLTAPWSASPWMKTIDTWTYPGKLRRENWQLWANYFIKYFQAYKGHGLEFWAASPQNEPMIYTYLNTTINGMAWTAEEQGEWLVNHLAPTLFRAGFPDIKIIIGDDNRQCLLDWPKTIMSDVVARSIVAGTALHWYFDEKYPATLLDQTKAKFPDKLLLYTEACTGVNQERSVILGSWKRGEDYATDIIENLSHWVSSWIDWNIALNEHGGPNWVGNFVDSPIIVNASADEFYKQPMYYVMGHFSKYIPPNSFRVGSKTVGELANVTHVAFRTRDEATVVVILNTSHEPKEILVEDASKGVTKLTVLAKSINTLKYW